MKFSKLFLSIFFIVGFFPLSVFASFDTNLYYGLTSPDVTALQVLLNKDPATQVAATGYSSPGYEIPRFGPKTVSAVKRFQTLHGLPHSGYVGAQTRAVLNQLLAPVVVLPQQQVSTSATPAGLCSINSFTVDQNPIPVGTGAHLHWQTTNCTSVTISNVTTTPLPLTGDVVTDALTTSVTFELTALDAVGKSTSWDVPVNAWDADSSMQSGSGATNMGIVADQEIDPHVAFFVGKTLWPQIYGKAGPYSISKVNELDDIGAAGFNLSVMGYTPPGSAWYQKILSNNIKYFDKYPWYAIYNVCHTRAAPCVLSATEMQSILTQVQTHLTAVSQDANIVGFWVLDDYPGDIHTILEQIHAAVVEANKTSIFPRATACGFGGRLDIKKNITDANFMPISSGTDAGFDTTLVNFTPNACDIISPYPYGRTSTDNPDLVDWSMSSLLPRYKQMFKNHGWDQMQQPLLPLAHTFGFNAGTATSPSYYTTPRQSDVTAQVQAYCQAGAIGMMAYAWDDSGTGPKKELFNSPEMVAGLKDGIASCGW